MAKITVNVDTNSLLKEVENLESAMSTIDKKLTSKLTMFVLQDIRPFVPVDTGKTQASMYQYTLFAEGLIQWIRQHDTKGYDVVQFIHRSQPWVDDWLESGGLERTEQKYLDLLEDYFNGI